MSQVGILSDTHLSSCTDAFVDLVQKTFANCSVIIHAGDLTDTAILTAFSGKDVHAVHGNMCNFQTQELLPHHKCIIIEGYTLGVCHGAGLRNNIEERVWQLFPEADCIIYGHTHRPVCEKRGDVLFINPGSFHATGPYGAPGTYALLNINSTELSAKIHNLS